MPRTAFVIALKVTVCVVAGMSGCPDSQLRTKGAGSNPQNDSLESRRTTLSDAHSLLHPLSSHDGNSGLSSFVSQRTPSRDDGGRSLSFSVSGTE